MGACNDYRFSRNEDKAKADKEFLAWVEDKKYESGHGGYTGTIAEHSDLEHHDKVFGSMESAEDYIQEKAEKWEATIAVKVESDQHKGYLYGGCYSS